MGLRPKKCRAGAGWDGLRGGCGLEVCGAGGSGQNFSSPAGAGRGGFIFCGCGAGADKKFQPAQDSSVYGEFTDPFLSSLAEKLDDMSGGPRERQWFHQRLSFAVVKENAARILTCVQV